MFVWSVWLECSVQGGRVMKNLLVVVASDDAVFVVMLLFRECRFSCWRQAISYKEYAQDLSKDSSKAY